MLAVKYLMEKINFLFFFCNCQMEQMFFFFPCTFPQGFFSVNLQPFKQLDMRNIFF